jgi:hypothetical protein
VTSGFPAQKAKRPILDVLQRFKIYFKREICFDCSLKTENVAATSVAAFSRRNQHYLKKPKNYTLESTESGKFSFQQSDLKRKLNIQVGKTYKFFHF